MKLAFSLDAFDPEIFQPQAGKMRVLLITGGPLQKWATAARGRKTLGEKREQRLMFEIGGMIVRGDARAFHAPKQQSENRRTFHPAPGFEAVLPSVLYVSRGQRRK